jgi:IclR family acetate operon transcriptional repressor
VDQPRRTEPAPVRSVARALKLLKAVGDGKRSTGQLQKAADIPGPTAVRLLNALENEGFVSRGPGGYSPGPAIIRMFFALEPDSLIWRLVKSAVAELNEKTHETSLFMVESDGMRECLAVGETKDQIRRVVPVGGRFPLHQGASGIVFLAHGGLKKSLPLITDSDGNYDTRSSGKRPVADLVADCERALRDGVAESIGTESWGVAAPVLSNGALIGVLSVSAPAFRYSPERLTTFTEICREVAARTSDLLARVASGFELPDTPGGGLTAS